MIGVVAKLKAKSGSELQVEHVARRLVEKALQESGSKAYTLWRTSDPSTLFFVELYQDKAAIEAHEKSDHFRQAIGELTPLLAAKPELQVLTEMIAGEFKQ